MIRPVPAEGRESRAIRGRVMDEKSAAINDPRAEPVDVAPAGDAGFWAAPWIAQATIGFVALGVMLRVARYLLNFPLWCDETMIAANFLDRGYADLFRPLDYRQVSPVLFLVIELTAVKLMGFSELSLRFFPMACGVATVPLFRHAAGRVLKGVPLLLAVAIFAVAGWPLRYVAEVKPYASDLFAALVLLALALEWCRRPDRVRWLWALAVAAPVSVALSLPSVFVVGGVGLALVGSVWNSRRWGVRVAYLVGNVAAAATFVGLARFYKTAPQDHDYFHNAWADAFPPLDGAWRLLKWLCEVHTGFMFAYPEGGAHGASTLTFLCFAAAVVLLWRRGRRSVVGLCLAPLGLAMVAAAIHRYPYGVSARTTQYAAPAVCVLSGLGAAYGLSLLRGTEARRRGLIGVVGALATLGIARLGADMNHPYKTVTDDRVRAFARWFWAEQSRGGVLVCARRDLGRTFDPRHWTRDATDTYLCYRAIYGPRREPETPVDLGAVSHARPLRVVLFNEFPAGTPSFDGWMAGMLTRFDVLRVVSYPVSSVERKIGPTWDEVYVVYEFVPKAGTSLPVAVGAPTLRR